MQPVRLDICAYDSPEGVGGPYIWMQRMPQALRERGFDVRVRLFYWGNLENGVLYRSLTEDGIPFVAAHFKDSVSNVRWLLAGVLESAPDVFLTDNVIPAYLSVRYLKRAGIPCVGILRSDDTFYHGIIDRFVAGRAEDRVDAIVCVSEFLTNTVRERAGGALDIHQIASGTPIPSDVAIPPNSVLKIAYVGRLVEEQKQILATVRVLIAITSQLTGVEATIYGDGPEKERIQQLLSVSGGHVKFGGNLTSLELQQRLVASHVIVLLSDYEGTPTAIMEAMACGVVPVCLRMRSGIPELVEHQVTGLIVEDRGHSVFNAIQRLRDETGLWERLSSASRRRAEERFAFQRCADRWAELIGKHAYVSRVRTSVTLPLKLQLAASHPGFAHHHPGLPSPLSKCVTATQRFFRRLRMLIGRIRRRLIRTR